MSLQQAIIHLCQTYNIDSKSLIQSIQNLLCHNQSAFSLSQVKTQPDSNLKVTDELSLDRSRLGYSTNLPVASHKGSPCSIADCKVKRCSKPKLINGEVVCATHYKQIIAKDFKLNAVKCNHVHTHGDKIGTSCSSKAVIYGFCNRHQKKKIQRCNHDSVRAE